MIGMTLSRYWMIDRLGCLRCRLSVGTKQPNG